jgi:hypothetical protein
MVGMPRPAVLLVLVVALAGGCASVKPHAAVNDPVPVYLGDFGVHSGLFLPTADGRYVEYLFGDWRYAAENKCMPHDAIVALAASPGSAFGRLYHDRLLGKDEPDLTARQPAGLQRIDCERIEVYALIDRLDRRFAALVAKNGPPLKNPETGVDFVRDEGHYSWANNCNHLTAQSLRELGCEVSGVVVWSKFKVEEPEKSARTTPKEPVQHVPGWAALE